jgi:hypothetical protein
MPRNPQRTDEWLLHVAAQEIHKSGFRGADFENNLDESECDEGRALSSLCEQGRASDTLWWRRSLPGLAARSGPLIGILRSASLSPEAVALGCPMNKLVQETAPLDEVNDLPVL